MTDYDISICQHVAAVVSHRAALLVSIVTSVIMARLTCPDVTVAIDGSVYKNHPRMDAWMNRTISKLNTTKKIVSKLKKNTFDSMDFYTLNQRKFHFLIGLKL